MPTTIVQKIMFKNTSPKALYDLYMNAKKHSVATAAPAKITAKVDTDFSTHGGYITGKNIYLIKDKLIVQSWRTKEWNDSDPDSTFIIELEPKGKNTLLHMIHANLPDKHAESINKGWDQHYWQPWKKYLAGKPIDKHPTM
jgi:activator of HSP90 ATPase